MKNILVLLMCAVLVGAAWGRYTRYPSGVQVWVQKVKVFEVSKTGQVIDSRPNNYQDDEDAPNIDVRFGSELPMNNRRNNVQVWVQNVPATRIFSQRVYPNQYPNNKPQHSAFDATKCPASVKVGNVCTYRD